MILYHGTTGKNARTIMKEGFLPGKKYNWEVKSKPGFVYLSLAYAPFYAMATNETGEGALIKVEVDEHDLYPEDDFMMGKQKYSQEDLDKIDLEHNKQLAPDSLKYLGNACAKTKDIKIIGCTYFNAEGLLLFCDPIITPTNFASMGQYYIELTEWIYGGNKFEDFKRRF